MAHLGVRGVPTESPASQRVPASVANGSAFGSILSAVHEALDDFTMPVGAGWLRISKGTLIGRGPDWLRRLFASATDDQRLLVEWWTAIDEHVGDSSDIGICHGEAYPSTFRLNDSGTLAVSELDWVGKGPRIYDLATYRWVLELHHPTEARTTFLQFLDAYAVMRPVPSLERLNAWVAARHLWSLRLAASFETPAGLAGRAEFARSWPL